MFEMEGCELEFRESALTSIAAKAMERKTGARGLRSILEYALLDTMYDLPSLDNLEEVVIDEGLISGEGEPIFIYENPEPLAASADE